MTYTLALGNAWDGIHLVGLFASHEEALEYATNNPFGDEWAIVSIFTTIPKKDSL